MPHLRVLLGFADAPGHSLEETSLSVLSSNGTPGPWQSGGLFTNSRSMTINGLTPGTN